MQVLGRGELRLLEHHLILLQKIIDALSPLSLTSNEVTFILLLISVMICFADYRLRHANSAYGSGKSKLIIRNDPTLFVRTVMQTCLSKSSLAKTELQKGYLANS